MAPKKGGTPTPAEAPTEETHVEEVKEEALQGDFLFPDGTIYKGWYLKKATGDVCLHGEGQLQSGPESFKGVFERGQYKTGKYTSCNGSVYEGSFKDSLFHGLGDYSWPDGRTYKGTWKAGRMHGQGQFQNFSFGADKEFRGFSVNGAFCSDATAQEEARKSFMAEYGTDYITSAKEALKAMGEKTGAEGPPDSALVPPVPEPGADEAPELKAARGRADELVKGPFPKKEAVSEAGLKALAAGCADGADPACEVVLCEDKRECASLIGRVRHDQLQHVGQVIEFAFPEADPAAQPLCRLALLNVSQEYEVSMADWKIVHVEETPPGTS